MTTNWKFALHSVSYCGYWGQAQLPLEKFIERAATLGYNSIMLTAKRPHASLLDSDETKRRHWKKLLEDNGVQLGIVAGYNDFCGGSETADIPYREMQVLHITELARLARDLGGDKVRVFTGYERPHLSYDLQWSWCVQGLKEAAQRAADCGVTLCVQNHHDIAAHYESMFDLLTEIDEPNCKAAYDAWTPAIHGDDLSAAVRRMAPLMAWTTVADYVRRPRTTYVPRLVNYQLQSDVLRAVPMGEGFIDYRTFFKALHESEYSGGVGYEMCSTLRGGGSEENLDHYARRFLMWMKEL
jgi:sugar phosphate isomerase/epimerase